MGRCGEYSVLMMQMLESLDYDTKWVVDWADHVRTYQLSRPNMQIRI